MKISMTLKRFKAFGFVFYFSIFFVCLLEVKEKKIEKKLPEFGKIVKI